MHSVVVRCSNVFFSTYVDLKCMASCTIFFLLSCLKEVSTFNESDLNMVLNDGTCLYSQLLRCEKLSSSPNECSILPRYMERDGMFFSKKDKGNTSGIIDLKGGTGQKTTNALALSLKQMLTMSPMCIFVADKIIFAILKGKNSDSFYFFQPFKPANNDEGSASCILSSFPSRLSRKPVSKEFKNHCMPVRNDADKVVQKFKSSVSMGPAFVCTCCYQTWFQHNVREKDPKWISKLPLFLKKCFFKMKSFQSKEWVCRSCYESVRSGSIPRFALCNGMGFPERPPELDLTELEERLISPRIPFMQIVEKPRGGQRSLKGNVVNVPTDVDTTVKCLPRTLNDSQTIQVKLKRKLNFKHSVLYESIRPNVCLQALHWLLNHSVLFQSEGICLRQDWDLSDLGDFLGHDDLLHHNNIQTEDSNGIQTVINESSENSSNSQSTTRSSHVNCKENVQDIQTKGFGSEIRRGNYTSAKENNESDDENDGWTEIVKSDERVLGSSDTLLHPCAVQSETKVLSIAPGEGQTPLGLYQDMDSEYLSFPSIFCGQRRPSNRERKVPVFYSDICKWELRSFDRRAALSIPNLFYKVKKIQIKQIQDKVALAMRKCSNDGKKVTVADVLNPDSFNNIVRLNEGYRVLRKLRGSPAYWESTKRDIFSMIRQLGIPTWFCSLSAADTKWPGLLRVLSKQLWHKELSDEDLSNLTWVEKCKLVKSDPVTCARYFHNRVQVFFEQVLQSELKPLGHIRDFFYRVEFQQRGSPHIHMLLWISDSPQYGKADNSHVTDFIDAHSTCAKSVVDISSDLINYQTHRHAATCKKKSKLVCRFGFPLPPMPETIILEPLEDNADIDYSEKCEQLSKCLNEMKLGEEISFSEFLNIIKMTKDEYIKCIRSSLTSPKVFLKRCPSEIRINPYNDIMLRSWEANIDVQFVLDAYACAAYIASYISKGQRGMSDLMTKACQEARDGNKDLKQQVRHIGNKFLTHIELCSQEAAYLVLQLPLRRSSRGYAYINTIEPSKRCFLLKGVDTLESMPKTSTQIESDNNIKRYARRPRTLENCCLADFISKYRIVLPKKKNISESLETTKLPTLPETCVDSDEELIENSNDSDQEHTTSSIRNDSSCTAMDMTDVHLCQEDLMSYPTGKEEEHVMKDGTVIKKCSVNKILRWYGFSMDNDPENYYREQLMLFCPWRDESFDLIQSFLTYKECYEHNIEAITRNKSDYSADEIVEEILESHCSETNLNNDVTAPEVQHQEAIDCAIEPSPCELYGCFDPTQYPNRCNYDLALDMGITRKQLSTTTRVVNSMSTDDYMSLVRSLNQKQLAFFHHVLFLLKTGKVPFHYFLTGGAGVGKSVLTTALYQSVVRYYMKQVGSCPDDIHALLCAPTGKAAYNIGGQTIHSLFCIPAKQSFHYKPLDSQQLDAMRVRLQNLNILFIDEVSMVGNKMFNYINHRLQEVFASKQPFGGLSVIAIGDLYQLKPVMDSWIFQDLSEDYGPLCMNLWRDLFQVYELTEIMRQKEDEHFAKLLNRLREGNHTQEDIDILKTRLVDGTSLHIERPDIPFLFTTNAEVDRFNSAAYESKDIAQKCSVNAIDTVSGDVSDETKERILTQIPTDPSKTMGLVKKLDVAEGLQVEICVNVDVEDGLANGTPGVVEKVDYRVPGSRRCSILWVLFSDKAIGSLLRQKYAHLYTARIKKAWTPIVEISRKFSVGKRKACFVNRRQFPLRLAAAKTIHKSQGSTMQSAAVHFGKRKSDHMHYVGLSRIKKLCDVHILELNEKKISVSADVKAEMNRMLMSSLLTPFLETPRNKLNIMFHNTRSLHAHIQDLRNAVAKGMYNCDVIALAESWLNVKDRDEDYLLPGYTMHRFDAMSPSTSRPHKGMVIYSRLNGLTVQQSNVGEIETVITTLETGLSKMQVIFMYCPPNQATVDTMKRYFCKVLELTDERFPLIVMGDTNIGACDHVTLQQFLSAHSIHQLISENTTDYCTCLDHIYIHNTNSFETIGCVSESYYSDHKPILVSVSPYP